MKITRDVITDLLPAYLSGEASQDTRTLVEAYFRQDPQFEKLARQGQTQLDVLAAASTSSLQEKEALMRVKKVLSMRSILLGAALFCSLTPFSVAWNSEQGITWFMLRDFPAMAGVFALAAVLAWGAYLWTFRALRDV